MALLIFWADRACIGPWIYWADIICNIVGMIGLIWFVNILGFIVHHVFVNGIDGVVVEWAVCTMLVGNVYKIMQVQVYKAHSNVAPRTYIIL